MDYSYSKGKTKRRIADDGVSDKLICNFYFFSSKFFHLLHFQKKIIILFSFILIFLTLCNYILTENLNPENF